MTNYLVTERSGVSPTFIVNSVFGIVKRTLYGNIFL